MIYCFLVEGDERIDLMKKMEDTDVVIAAVDCWLLFVLVSLVVELCFGDFMERNRRSYPDFLNRIRDRRRDLSAKNDQF